MSWNKLLGTLLALAVIIGGSAGDLSAQGGPWAEPGDGEHPYFASSDDVVAIRAGRLFDGTGTTYDLDQVILIRGQDIVEIGPNVDIPSGATVIDLSDATVLPGMIDTHVHMMGFGAPSNQWIGASNQQKWLYIRASRSSSTKGRGRIYRGPPSSSETRSWMAGFWARGCRLPARS